MRTNRALPPRLGDPSIGALVTDAGVAVVDVAEDSQSDPTITSLTDAGDVRIGYRGGESND